MQRLVKSLVVGHQDGPSALSDRHRRKARRSQALRYFLPTIESADHGVGIKKNLSIGDLTPAGSSRGRQIRGERLDRVDFATPRSQLFL